MPANRRRAVHPDKLKRMFQAAAQVALEMRDGLESVWLHPHYDDHVTVSLSNAYFDSLVTEQRARPETDSVDREDGRLASAKAWFFVEVGETRVEVSSIYSKLPAWWPTQARAIDVRR